MLKSRCRSRSSFRPVVVAMVRSLIHSRKVSGAASAVDSLGSWGWDGENKPPILMGPSIRRGRPIPRVDLNSVGVSSVLGRRPTNEDRWLAISLNPDILCLALFDGHGGSQCSEYCTDRFQDHILFWLRRGEALEAALQMSLPEINNAFARWVVFGQQGGSTSGSTATVCILREGVELVVGHVGDSRALLCRDGEPRNLTVDHSPSLIAEKRRIINSGGHIAHAEGGGAGLVNGRLAMSRSVGDLELKSYGVVAVPDTRTLEVRPSRDAFLVLTTDGINSVMSDHEICDVVRRCENPQEAASLLTDQALAYASEDNATAMVLPLGGWRLQNNVAAPVFHSFGRNMSLSSRFS